MHPTALMNGKLFFETYATQAGATVVDIGAQDVNGSLKDVMPAHLRYIGVDFVAGKGVDVILDDPYKLPFEDESVDIIVSSSCLEHSEMFWLAFLELLRVLRPNGLLYLNVPSNGDFHRYPVDCWRFYPDSGGALVAWARRNGMQPQLLESFISAQFMDPWNDYIAVFVKDEKFATSHPKRMISIAKNIRNGIVAGQSEMINPQRRTQDQTNLIYRFKRWRWRRYRKAMARNRTPD